MFLRQFALPGNNGFLLHLHVEHLTKVIALLDRYVRVRRRSPISAVGCPSSSPNNSSIPITQQENAVTGRHSMSEQFDLYNPTYGNFADTVLEQIRRETYGEDVGQNSWLTADECRQFLEMLSLTNESQVIEIACGSGGLAIFIAKTIGCNVLGIDINEKGIANANQRAIAQKLNGQIRFLHGDASQQLAFDEGLFDVLICIDSINHLPNRQRVLTDWYRILKPGGSVLFTDPIIVTGILSNDEIAVRSSIGYFLFIPVGENERLLTAAGFESLQQRDTTGSAAVVAKRWHDARNNHRDDLLKIEDKSTFEGLQQFLKVVHLLYSEKRLSRIAYIARKPA
jgi:2-polyprenyl-3-methyl-5-hydroxy-6-metoxy-1,4-benzoquinol methylase